MFGTALTEAELSFYSTAAQVIPVLLLAMALELSTTSIVRDFFSVLPVGSSARIIARLIVFAILVLMSGAELLALDALEGGSAGPSRHRWVMGALLVGIVVVMLGVLDKVFSSRRDASAERAPERGRPRERT